MPRLAWLSCAVRACGGQRVAAAALALALLAAVSPPAEARLPRATAVPSPLDPPGEATPEAVFRAMNLERSRQGRPPLREDERLDAAARDRMEDMFAQGYFGHVAPDGTEPFVWVARHGYRFHSVGENLAVGYGSATAAVAAWMRSPSHRRTLLGDFTEAGVAVAPGSPDRPGRGYTFVALYARPSR